MIAPFALILGSGHGVRRVDPTLSYPTALREIAGIGSALSWTRQALKEAGVDNYCFVAGYHLEKILAAQPDLAVCLHQRWETEGEAAALLAASERAAGAAALLIFPAHLIFRREALSHLLATPADLVFGMTAADPAAGPAAETGFILARNQTVSRLFAAARALAAAQPRATLAHLALRLIEESSPFTALDLRRLTASLRSPRGLAEFVLGTKGETLERLRPLVRSAVIEPVVVFTVREWRASRAALLDRLRREIAADSFMVRSSSRQEDCWHGSAAGRFLSLPAVPSARLAEAVDRVADSYETKGEADEAHQVLVQPYLAAALANGVLFTRHPDDGGPYRVLTIAADTGRTDTVTGGRAGAIRTVLRYRGAGTAAAPAGEHAPLWRLADELEKLVQHDRLDVEFALDRAGRPHLFQVRPLADPALPQAAADEDLAVEIESIRRHLTLADRPHPHLLGRRTLFGIMPDWNPAEIIGACPRPLALSLYRFLLMNDTWARARALLGYRDVTPAPLLMAFGGRPYVDVRASLNSFLPADLPEEIGERVVEEGIARLARQPELHDKIEFHLLPTCLDLDAAAWRERWQEAGWPEARQAAYLASLRRLTQGIIDGPGAAPQAAALETLARRRGPWLESAASEPASRLAAVHGLLADCRDFGALPFAVLARHAFIALAFLRSMRRRGILSFEETNRVLAGIPTVASECAQALRLCREGRLDRGAFLEQYGHLRPGTYDMLSPSYAEAPDFYLAGESAPAPSETTTGAAIIRGKAKALDEALAEAGFAFTSGRLVEFIAASIAARETAKFAFTRNLSAALSLLAAAGADMGFDRDALSFLTIERLLPLATDTPSAAEITELQRAVNHGRKRFAVTTCLRLPPLIAGPADALEFALPPVKPNFITRRRVTAPVRTITSHEQPPDLSGRIVAIECADPGFDWIFGHRLAGLVTMYGGMASHMAIRAAEFQLPAAIGCGEELFERIRRAERIMIDGEAEEIRFMP